MECFAAAKRNVRMLLKVLRKRNPVLASRHLPKVGSEGPRLYAVRPPSTHKAVPARRTHTLLAIGIGEPESSGSQLVQVGCQGGVVPVRAKLGAKIVDDEVQDILCSRWCWRRWCWWRWCWRSNYTRGARAWFESRRAAEGVQAALRRRKAATRVALLPQAPCRAPCGCIARGAASGGGGTFLLLQVAFAASIDANVFLRRRRARWRC